MHLSLKGSLSSQLLFNIGETKLLTKYSGAAAAYSLRNLSGAINPVVRVRRASDNDEKDFLASQVSSGEMVNWVNSQTVPPLDIGVETSEGRIPVPEGGDSIGTPAAAYSLRNLSTTYTGNVVDVRRNSDGTEESFTAEEVNDGTLEAWVLAPVSSLIGNRMYFDGVDDFVSLGSSVTFSGDFEISFKVIVTGNLGNNQAFLGSSFTQSIRLTSANTFRIDTSDGDNIFTSLGSAKVGTIYNMIVSRSGSEWTWNVNGTSQTIDYGSVSDFSISTIGARYANNLRINGVIYDINLNNQASYQGYGNTNADWEDQTGSNDGTVAGSPELFTGQGLDGTVSKWYDQSGNTNHAVQTTPANQPTIVEGGSLVTGGLDFDGVDDTLILSSFSGGSISQPFSMFVAAKSDVLDDNQKIVSGDNRIFIGNSESVDGKYNLRGGGTIIEGNTTADDSYHLLTGLFNTTDELFLDGTLEASGDSGSSSLTDLHIGQQDSGFNQFDGIIGELIIYPSDQSDNRTAIEANIGETYGITGIPAYDNTVDGFVETWYDQSGNGNDATQSVATSQPKIVSAGVLILDDQGNATIKFDGIDDFLDCGARVVELSANAATVFAVSQKDGGTLSKPGYTCSEGDVADPYSSNFILSSTQGDEVVWVNATTFGTGGAGLRLESFLYDQVNFQAYVNGATSGAAGAATVNAEITNTIIGASADGTTANSARKITALISYKSNQSANIAEIHSTINDLYNIY